MNPDTGELVTLKDVFKDFIPETTTPQDAIRDYQKRLAEAAERESARALTREEAEAEGFEELPPELNRAARRAIAQGRNPIAVETSSGKLARWARKTKRERRA